MKTINRKLLSLLLAIVLVLGMAVPMASAANDDPELGTARWAINWTDLDNSSPNVCGTITCYKLDAGKTTTYQDANLSTYSGWVDGTDVITIKKIAQNSNKTWYAYITYNVNSGGTKNAYIALSSISVDVKKQAGVEKRAGTKISGIYRRPDGTQWSGYISAGSDVYVLGTENGYTQVLYPTGSTSGEKPARGDNTWKLAWIKSDVAQHNLVSKQDYSSWSSKGYGYKNEAGTQPATIGSSGCGLLAIVNAIYYLNGQMVPPEEVAKYSLDYGYRPNGGGTRSTLARSFCKFENRGEKYGVKVVATINGNSYSKSADLLAAVQPYLTGSTGDGKCTVILNVQDHYVALVDYKASTKQYLIYDSAVSGTWTNTNGYRWMTAEQFTKKMMIAGLAGSGVVQYHTVIGKK